jgi:hypothetical protein
MRFAVSLADIQRAGLTFTADEAVAVAQRLIHNHDSAPPEPPFGAPSLENVHVTDTGEVECRACEVTPAVSEIAILLQSMLAPGLHAPSGLRYAIARALHDVDAPPFDSTGDFSATLARYEPPDCGAVIRRLVKRAHAAMPRYAPSRRLCIAAIVLLAALTAAAVAAIRRHDVRPVVPPVAATRGDDVRPVVPAVAPVAAARPIEPPRATAQAKHPVHQAKPRKASAPTWIDKLRLRWLKNRLALRNDLSRGL